VESGPLPLDPAAIRRDFPILDQTIHDRFPLVYLDSAASSQRPRQVIDALRDVYERNYANVHRGIHWLSERSTDLFEEARESIQALVGARHAHEIILTSGTTAGVNLVARSWGDANLRPGDEILLTDMEHHSNIVPWQQAAERTGAAVRFLPITDSGELDLEQLDAFLTDRTRLVAVTAVSNVLGTINPIGAIRERADRCGALLFVDGAQSVPHEPTDVQATRADFLAFSGHKMMGPSGVGALYGRETLLDAMPPFLGGGGMIRRVARDRFAPADLPFKFEAGTPPIADAIAMTAACRYLRDVGLERIAAHEQRLARLAHERLAAFDDVAIHGPAPDRKAGIVSFSIDRVHPQDISELLDHRGIAVRAGHHCAMPLHERLGVSASVRASFYAYTTVDEIDRFADGLRSVRETLRRTGSRRAPTAR